MTRAFGVDGRAVIVSDRGLTQNVIPDSEVVHHFEDDSLSAYTGSASSFAIQQGTVYSAEGTHALEYTASGNTNAIFSQSGLQNYPSSGDEFGWLTYIPSSSSTSGGGYLCSTTFAEQGSSGGDGNGTQHEPGDGIWEVGNIGSSITNDTTSVPLTYGTDVPYDTWIEERITGYDGSQFTATLYDGPSWDGGTKVAQTTYSGTVRSGGGVSFQAYDQVFWDTYAIWL